MFGEKTDWWFLGMEGVGVGRLQRRMRELLEVMEIINLLW